MISTRVTFSNNKTFVSEDSLPFYPRLMYAKHLHQMPPEYKSILELHNGYPLLPIDPTQHKSPYGDPSVIPVMTLPKMDFTNFDYRWQMFQYKILQRHIQKQKPGWNETKIKKEAAHVFSILFQGDTAYTNKWGTDNDCRDYVNFSGKPDKFIRRFPVVSGGNYYQVLSEPENVGGMKRSRISQFNASFPPPNADTISLDDPRFFMSWIETRILTYSGGREIRPFEYRTTDFYTTKDSTKGYPVAGLVARADFAWIETARLRI